MADTEFKTLTEAERAALLKKIALMQALVDHPNTGENERLAALASIRRLSDRYAISADDIADADQMQVVDMGIEFSVPLARERLYVIIVLSKLADFCNCKLLTITPITNTHEVHALRIIGARMDAEVVRSAIGFMMGQVHKHLKAFYKDVVAAYAIIQGVYDQRWREKDYFGADDFDPHRRQVAVSLHATMNPISIYDPEAGAGTADWMEAYEYKRTVRKVASALFNTEPEMPSINDAPWLVIETDWGIGFATRITHRLDTEFDKTEDDETLDALDRKTAEPVPNLPALATGTSLALMTQQVRADKLAKIEEHLSAEDLGTVQADMFVKDTALTRAGAAKADAVKLDHLRPTTEKEKRA